MLILVDSIISFNLIDFPKLHSDFLTLQVIEDLYTIWNWILTEKLRIPPADRNLYHVVLVVPETFDNRGTMLVPFVLLV